MTPGPSSAPPYLRTARSPRMLALLVLLLTAAAVCGRLGAWQLDRAELRGRAAAEREAAAQAAADPVPLDDVLRPQQAFTGDLVGTKVSLRGEATGEQLLVPGRSVGDERTGLLVLAGVRVLDGQGAEVGLLPVARGWVPDGTTAVEPLPAGPLDLVGYLQAGEEASVERLPPGQVGSISPGQLVNRWGGPIYAGYLVLVASDPPQADDVETLPPPTALGRGLNLQNLAYALQWWVFGGFAVLLWVRMVRDEARDAVEPAEPARPAEPDADVPV